MAATPPQDDGSHEEKTWRWALLLLLLFVFLGWWFFRPGDPSGTGGSGPAGDSGKETAAAKGTGHPPGKFNAGSRERQRRGMDPSTQGKDTEKPGQTATLPETPDGRAMVWREEMAVVKSGKLLEIFGKEQLTNEILEGAVRTASAKRGVRFVLSGDTMAQGETAMFLSTRGLTDLTEEVRGLLVTRYRLSPQKPVKPGEPKQEVRRAITKAGK